MGSDPRKGVSRSQWLRRLASRRRDRTAFVLSGGGPYGALQVGALRALLERDIAPDLIVGTSVGSLNAAFLAFDPTPHGVHRMETIWRGMTEEDLFPGARFKTSWARMLMKGNRVFDNTGMRKLIATRLGNARFEDSKVPLAVVATDLESGFESVFMTGEVTEPLLASCAMPGIFPPIEMGGRTYVDGGVANAVPIAPAVEMGANRVYVINCSAGDMRPRPLNRPMDILLHAFALSRARRLELEVPMFEGRAEVILIPVPVLDFTVPLTSFAYTEQLLEIGYTSAAEFLAGVGPELANDSSQS